MLHTLNRVLKKLVPQSWRHRLVKFYLLNIEQRQDTFDPALSSQQFRCSLALWDILNHGQGYLNSLRYKKCLNAQGEPIPWYTYPAIEFLDKLDFSQKDVFEWGAGNSTLWWSKQAKSVVSVEENRDWYELIKETMPGNCRIFLEPSPRRYEKSIHQFPGGFDVIIIDGGNYRMSRRWCAEEAIDCLRPGGMIILDNADWLPQSAQFLRDAGLIEVDLFGFVPLNDFAGATSLFLTRDFNIKPKSFMHPTAPIGGITQNWETLDPSQREE